MVSKLYCVDRGCRFISLGVEDISFLELFRILVGFTVLGFASLFDCDTPKGRVLETINFSLVSAPLQTQSRLD
jgi:hypothetical protein